MTQQMDQAVRVDAGNPDEQAMFERGMAMTWMQRFDAFRASHASDAHLANGQAVRLRIDGFLLSTDSTVTQGQLQSLLEMVFGESVAQALFSGEQPRVHGEWNGLRMSAAPVTAPVQAVHVMVRLK